MMERLPSPNRAHLAALQRKRRAGMVRIDYMPSEAALAAIEAKRATMRPGSAAATNSATLDAILTEWAGLAGIGGSEAEPPSAKGSAPEFCGQYARARITSEPERPARAQESGECTGIAAHIAQARAGAYDSGLATSQRAALRVPCRAKRHRDGKPCQAKSEPGKRRCRFHGGRSTGPRTPEGKARALANLRQYRGRGLQTRGDCSES